VASITGMASDACVALRSGASQLIAPRQTCVTCTALCVAGIRRTRTALCIAGIDRTRSALRIARIGRASSAIRIARIAGGCASMLTAMRVTGTARITLSPGARITLRPRTGIIARKSEVRAWNRDGGPCRPQLNIKVELVRGCTRIMLPRYALSGYYWRILLYEYPGAA
jgi:hypothetical protein